MAIANASMLRTGGLVTRAAAGIGLAVTGIGIVSLRAAGNFEQSMNILQAVSEATGTQMNALQKEAIALGADLKLPNVSAKDAADAMQELAKGGLSVNQILGATRGTLQLGLAANMGYADSATIVARALSSFNLSGREATTVADLFTAAANKSTADMTDVALGFQMASAQFAGTGHTIDELTTSLGLMANAGVVGSDAGTSLKTMINRLTAPTQKASDLMKELGIQVYDSSGNMKSMPDIIATLNKSMDGMSQKQRNAALYTIFGSDAIRAARIQMKAGEKGWLKFHDAITKGGEAQKFAESRTKGFNGALQAFGSAAETLAIQLGTALLPAATSLVRTFTRLLMAIDPNRIIAFFSAIASGVSAVFKFVDGSVLLKTAIIALGTTLIAYKGIMMGAAAAMRIASGAMALLNAVTAINPFVLIAAAIIGLGLALIYAYKHSETFRKIVDGVFSWLRDTVMTVVNFIRDHWMLLLGIFLGPFPLIIATIIKNWTKIKNVTMSIFSAIIGFFRKWWPLLLVIFTGGVALLPLLIAKHFGTIKRIATAIFGFIYNFIKGRVMAIVGTIKAVFGPLAGIVSAIWGKVRDKIVEPMARAVVAVGEKLAAILSKIKGYASDFFAAAVSLGQSIIMGVVSGIKSLAGAIGDALLDIAKSALDAALDFIKPGSPSKLFRDKVGVPIAQGIAEGIRKAAADIPRALTTTLSMAVDGIAQGPVSPPASIGALASGGAGTTQVVNNNWTIEGTVVDGRKLLDLVKNAQESHSRVNGGRDYIWGGDA
jgi:phage tail tape measure protein, TP901 family, core region